MSASSKSSIPSPTFATLIAALSVAACSSAQTDDVASQEGAYSAYDPSAAAADAGSGEGGAAATWAAEAPGIELDAKGFPKNKYIGGHSFSGCEYWPYAVSASPYPDHIQWGCTSGSDEAQLCMAAGMRRLAVILSDPPPQLAQVFEPVPGFAPLPWQVSQAALEGTRISAFLPE